MFTLNGDFKAAGNHNQRNRFRLERCCNDWALTLLPEWTLFCRRVHTCDWAYSINELTDPYFSLVSLFENLPLLCKSKCANLPLISYKYNDALNQYNIFPPSTVHSVKTRDEKQKDIFLRQRSHRLLWERKLPLTAVTSFFNEMHLGRKLKVRLCVTPAILSPVTAFELH